MGLPWPLTSQGSSQVHFANLQTPHCYFCWGLFCQLEFTSLPTPILPNCEVCVPNDEVDVAMFAFPSHQIHTTKETLPNCQVHVAMYASSTHLIHCQCNITQLSSPHAIFAFPTHQIHIAKNCQVHFTLWTARMNFKLPANVKLSGLSNAWILLQCAQMSAPKIQTAPDSCSSKAALHSPHPLFLPSLSCFILFFFCIDLMMALWNFSQALSKFKPSFDFAEFDCHVLNLRRKTLAFFLFRVCNKKSKGLPL